MPLTGSEKIGWWRIAHSVTGLGAFEEREFGLFFDGKAEQDAVAEVKADLQRPRKATKTAKAKGKG